MRQRPDTVSVQVQNYNTAASGGDSVITLNAVADEYHVIDWITFSYASDPTSGAIEVKDTTNNTILMGTDITVGGPGQFVFGDRGLVGLINTTITITLSDGSATKKLSAQTR